MRLLFLLLFLGTCLNLTAQDSITESRETGWQHFTYDMGNIFGGIGYSYTRPLSWKGKQWTHFGLVAVSSTAAYVLDEPVSEYFMGVREDIPRVVRDYGFQYGNPSNNYMLTGAIYMFGLFTDNPKLRRTGVLLIASASSAGLLQQILKSAVGRARPLAGVGKDTFDPFWSSNTDYHSFPSGHHMLAFTNAYVIAKQFKNPWIKAGIYTLGMVPGVSRMWEGKHWLSDLVFSTAVSIFTVEAIDRYLDRKYDQKYNDNNNALRWELQLGPGQLGVRMQF
jgi:membrane-associated phospholipid phosphatase